MSKRILARRGKKKKTTARVVFVELFTKGEYILCLRLTSKLVDLRQGYANSFTHSVNEVESSTASAKKKKTTARVVFFFLVEVWRFELQASSTRNWRATNCATPRYLIERHYSLDLILLLCYDPKVWPTFSAYYYIKTERICQELEVKKLKR